VSNDPFTNEPTRDARSNFTGERFPVQPKTTSLPVELGVKVRRGMVIVVHPHDDPKKG